VAGPPKAAGMNRRDLGPRAIFGAPLAIAVLSLTGLVGALLADGAWDWIGAGLLAVCLVVPAARFVRRGEPHQRRPPSRQ